VLTRWLLLPGTRKAAPNTCGCQSTSTTHIVEGSKVEHVEAEGGEVGCVVAGQRAVGGGGWAVAGQGEAVGQHLSVVGGLRVVCVSVLRCEHVGLLFF